MPDIEAHHAITERIRNLEQRIAQSIPNPFGTPLFDIKDVATHRPFDKPFPGVENPPVKIRLKAMAWPYVAASMMLVVIGIILCANGVGALPLVACVLVAGVMGINVYLFRQRAAKSVTIFDEDHIGLEGQLYAWSDIEGAFIVTRVRGKQYCYFLVLGLKDGRLVYHEFFNSDLRTTFTGQLCASIRYFMKEQKAGI